MEQRKLRPGARPAPPAPAPARPGLVEGTTSAGTAIQWQPLPAAPLRPAPAGEAAGLPAITVDPATRYQEYRGIGMSLDETSVSNIWKIKDPAAREATIEALASPTKGAGLNIYRLILGSSDVIEHLPFWSYDELPEGVAEDFELKYFSIEKDRRYHILDTAKLIQKYNPAATFYGAAWSAPGWMKTMNKFVGHMVPKDDGSDEWVQANRLRDDCIEVFARYYAKTVQAFAAEGIELISVSILNEPGLKTVYPAMDMTLAQQQALAKAMRREFDAAGLATEVWALDFNYCDWKSGPLDEKMNLYRLFDDPEVKAACGGIAFHSYWGDIADMKTAWEESGKPVHMTESDSFLPADVLDCFNHRASSFAGWTPVTDVNGGVLHTTYEMNNDPDWAAVPARPESFKPNRLGVVDPAAGSGSFTPALYGMGQLGRYLMNGTPARLGAVAVGCAAPEGLRAAAFQNPNGELVAVVLNEGPPLQALLHTGDGRQAEVCLPTGTTTLRWQAV